MQEANCYTSSPPGVSESNLHCRREQSCLAARTCRAGRAAAASCSGNWSPRAKRTSMGSASTWTGDSTAGQRTATIFLVARTGKTLAVCTVKSKHLEDPRLKVVRKTHRVTQSCCTGFALLDFYVTAAKRASLRSAEAQRVTPGDTTIHPHFWNQAVCAAYFAVWRTNSSTCATNGLTTHIHIQALQPLICARQRQLCLSKWTCLGSPKRTSRSAFAAGLLPCRI